MRRVPILLVIPLSLAAVAIPWWQGTRNLNFLAYPDEVRLAAIREDTRSSVPARSRLFPESAPVDSGEPVIPPPLRPRPQIDPEDPARPPALAAYADSAARGPAAFIELASYIEDNGYSQRALLAWERVLDSCQPDESQRQAALDGIQRLRPSAPWWNTDPANTRQLRIEITVPPKASTPGLAAAAASVADDMESITAGLVKFETRIDTTKKGNPFKGMAMKIAGMGDRPLVTATYQLDQVPESREVLVYQLFTGIFKLVAAQIAESTKLSPPVFPAADGDPRTALWQRVTRLTWLEFAKALQPPPPAPAEEKTGRARTGGGR